MYILAFLIFTLLPLIFLILFLTGAGELFAIGFIVPLIILVVLYQDGKDGGFPYWFKKMFRKKQKKMKLIISYDGKVYEIWKHLIKEKQLYCYHVDTEEFLLLHSKDKKIEFLYWDMEEYREKTTSKLTSSHKRIDKLR